MAKKVSHLEKLVGFEEVAQQLGMSVKFVRKAQYEMGLPHYKIGNRVKFKLSEIEMWLKQRKSAS